MNTHTESEIRKSFVNCSKGAAQRIAIPRTLLDADWESLIFLGWVDPKSPQSGYLVVETEAGLRGLALQKNPPKGRGSAQMCQLCMTLHPGSGVSLVSIQRSKSAKDRYNSMATYICSDLRCSDYTLGKKRPDGVRQMEETLSVEQRAERTLDNVRSLVERIESGSGARPR
ncbi:FBP domain-containing protein [Rothia halotolerans]|uniref:FBP domain-containing protein n=1 Tax=Rothia halotolerans TaxID=405770 RepID=UPI00101DA108|nr:FBP domain-containing protein [Rothia halotolerans]